MDKPTLELQFQEMNVTEVDLVGQGFNVLEKQGLILNSLEFNDVLDQTVCWTLCMRENSTVWMYEAQTDQEDILEYNTCL